MLLMVPEQWFSTHAPLTCELASSKKKKVYHIVFKNKFFLLWNTNIYTILYHLSQQDRHFPLSGVIYHLGIAYITSYKLLHQVRVNYQPEAIIVNPSTQQSSIISIANTACISRATFHSDLRRTPPPPTLKPPSCMLFHTSAQLLYYLSERKRSFVVQSLTTGPLLEVGGSLSQFSPRMLFSNAFPREVLKTALHYLN